MAYKFKSTGTVDLTQSGSNTVIAAPASGETFIRRLYVERTDTAVDVTLIFKNNAVTPRELLPKITLNDDKGVVWLEFTDDTEIGVGEELAFVVDASIANKARIYCDYRNDNRSVAWPA